MYIISVLKNLFRPSNIGTLIFFVLNAFMVVVMFSGGDPNAMLGLLIAYLVSVVIALSPIGEWFLGLLSGARRMTRMDMRNRIQPLLTRVHQKALATTPHMAKSLTLKVMYDPNPNAFALGRHTICVTEGLFDLPDEMIEGILAHEVGHLACHHTDIQLLIGGGNFIITFALAFLKLIAGLFTLIGAIFGVTEDSSAGCSFSIVGLICSLAVWLWTRFCMLFLMWSSRKNEYVADEYAMNIGYGYELAAALDSIGAGVPQSSFMKALYSSHPETHDRIGNLQAHGVPYTRY